MVEKFSDAEIEQIKQCADLVSIIGARVKLHKQGSEWKGLCPFHTEGTPSFYVIPKKRMYHCFGCGVTGDVFEWLKQIEKLSFPDAVEKLRVNYKPARKQTAQPVAPVSLVEEAAEIKKKIERSRKIWDESLPAHGTLVEKYLSARGVGDIMIPVTLRYHPRLWCDEVSGPLPAMVGAVTDARNQVVGVHRTWLRTDGSGKANLRSAKKMYGVCFGYHLRLGLPAMGTLAVAEGIETSLSIMKSMQGLGVWSAMSINNLCAPVPRTVTELILCADGDNKDPRAAEAIIQAAARKHAMPGRIVRIARPKSGCDFNDMIMGQ